MSVGSKIRESRKQAMLSQLQLASGSGVSLATLQSIERDRANPSLSTIVALGHYLGLSLKLEPEPINWPLLIAAGVPLSILGKLDGVPNKEAIPREIRKALGQPLTEREESAIAGFVLALKIHYPSLADRWFSRATMKRLNSKFSEPRILKLKRIATAEIAKYL